MSPDDQSGAQPLDATQNSDAGEKGVRKTLQQARHVAVFVAQFAAMMAAGWFIHGR